MCSEGADSEEVNAGTDAQNGREICCEYRKDDPGHGEKLPVL